MTSKAEVLAQCLEVRTRGGCAQSVLAKHPELSSELADLLGIADLVSRQRQLLKVEPVHLRLPALPNEETAPAPHLPARAVLGAASAFLVIAAAATSDDLVMPTLVATLISWIAW